ncbi:hypothetical protein CEXT_417271 [Caerostris extrusa]|uniref:Uncharacterized protein n=1 Tax=Caerostris extrusa TaxID=172846 RepID=A0AAV4PC82_CAEEX|nr:hypothetical protein CEXT_417271 [Caerostris extrusa]
MGVVRRDAVAEVLPMDENGERMMMMMMMGIFASMMDDFDQPEISDLKKMHWLENGKSHFSSGSLTALRSSKFFTKSHPRLLADGTVLSKDDNFTSQFVPGRLASIRFKSK